MRRRLIVALATAAVALLAVAVSASGSTSAARKTVTVQVADDYFAPTAVKIKSGDKVKYTWSYLNTDSHNVRLKTAPKGVDKKKFRSATGSIGIKFAPRFKVPGKYHFVCTLHSSVMQMDVTVKRH